LLEQHVDSADACQKLMLAVTVPLSEAAPRPPVEGDMTEKL